MFQLILGINIFSYLFERLCDYLDYIRLEAELPPRLQAVYNAEKYQKMLAYEKETTRFGFWSDTFSFVLTLGMLLCGGFAWLDNHIRNYTQNELVLSLLFLGIIGLISELLSLPFQIYSTFVIETKFGFNKSTVKLFFIDKLKGYVIGGLLGGGILASFIWFYTSLADNAWWVAWIFTTSIMVFMAMFYSSLILPIFNKLSPLPEGDLRHAIEAFCLKVGYKLNNLYVIDGSKRSTKANAFFSGLGPKKMIVLYDTLINNHTNDELVGVLAHEIGHYKKKHIVQGILLSVLQTGLMLYLLQYLLASSQLASALGAKIPSIHISLIAFGMLFSPVSLIIGIGMNYISRKNEYEADAFAAEQLSAKPLKDALVKLSADNLSNLQPHPFNVFISYSHPTLLQRLDALDKL